MTKSVWILTFIEYMQTQHTGFDDTTSIIAVFSKKPALAEISPHMKSLAPEMGEAIAQVATLLAEGSVELADGAEYCLTNWPLLPRAAQGKASS